MRSEQEQASAMGAVNVNMRSVRLLTSILLLLPYLCLLIQLWGFFLLLLFPASAILLLLHFFLGQKRRRLQQPMNEWDNTKIFLGIGGLLLGALLWVAAYVTTQ